MKIIGKASVRTGTVPQATTADKRKGFVMSEEKVMYDSDKAAKKVHNISGWIDIHGRFWGTDEHMARWSSCTHHICDCGEEVSKNWIKCEKCRHKKDVEKFRALESREWDGKTPLCLYNDDRYFFSEDELYDYAEDVGVKVESIGLVICQPVHLREVDPDYWCDELAEDGELPPEVKDALAVFNAVIKKQNPSAWEPGKYRAIIKKDSH